MSSTEPDDPPDILVVRGRRTVKALALLESGVLSLKGVTMLTDEAVEALSQPKNHCTSTA